MDMNTSRIKKVFGILGTILYFISYLPFVSMIVTGFDGAQEGLFGGRMLYGVEAMCNYLIWLCIVPIISICVIYQLIFGIAYIRKRRMLKIAAIGLVAALVIMILAAGFLAVNKNSRESSRVFA